MPTFDPAHRPSVLFKPELWRHRIAGEFIDRFGRELGSFDSCWIAQYHAFLAVGDTPEEAMRAFDESWNKEKAWE